MDMIREVVLSDMLEARETRAARIADALRHGHRTLLSFTMNIPGPVKVTPLILRGFREGQRRVEGALSAAHSFFLLFESEHFTGCEALYAIDGDAATIKKICIELENADGLSRLFDLDVIGAEGGAASRTELGCAERGCIVCGVPGRGCASRRIHSIEELQQAVKDRLVDFFDPIDRNTIVSLATESLLGEVRVTPKPGLVDRSNSGSHRDMDLPLFEKSAAALAPFWEECFSTGRKTASAPAGETFRQLRAVGLAAENAMLAATGGVNTHKGAVFLMGTLCGAIGRLINRQRHRPTAEELLAECGAMTAAAMESDFRRIRENGARTAGERLFLDHGLRGARGEAADGFPSVKNTALPVFRSLMANGCSREHSAAITLLHLIAMGTDTNLFHRGGADGAAWAAREAAKLIENGRIPTAEEIAELDLAFIERNLSPGGCADLLAVTLFLDRWERIGT